jgi:hypothetical protein
MTDAGPPGPPSYPAPPSHGFGSPGPYDPPGPSGPTGPTTPRRRAMLWRHVVGPLVALVATPIGLALVDYGADRYVRETYASFDDGWSAELLWLIAGGLFLVVAAASARLSGLGPILAAVVWTVVPFCWFVFDRGGFFDLVSDLPSTHLWFSYAPIEFPLAGALLVGAGVGGRWRGRVVPS